jgi:hypothetical protein
MHHLRIVLLLVLGLAPSCATVSPRPIGQDCALFCAHGAGLGCAWANPTPNGAGCLQWCSLMEGGPLPVDLTCASQASSCTEIDSCNR